MYQNSSTCPVLLIYWWRIESCCLCICLCIFGQWYKFTVYTSEWYANNTPFVLNLLVHFNFCSYIKMYTLEYNIWCNWGLPLIFRWAVYSIWYQSSDRWVSSSIRSTECQVRLRPPLRCIEHLSNKHTKLSLRNHLEFTWLSDILVS